jgi:GAF domain-containing protein
MIVAEFCSRLEAQLSSQPSDAERFEIMAKTIGWAFNASPNEVAIFQFDDKEEIVSFLWPLRLRKAGTIPISDHSALVIRTIRQKRAFLDNSFFTTPHASIFEQFRLDPQTAPMPIQKIMSVPLYRDDEIKGVIQVSRKGLSGDSAGEDFSANQLAALVKIAEIAVRFI